MNHRPHRTSSISISMLWIVAIASLRCGAEPKTSGETNGPSPAADGGPGSGDAAAPAPASERDGGPDVDGFVPGPVDDLLAALPANAWLELPNSEMRAVCPQPLSAYNCSSVQAAWSGGAYDTRRDRLVVFGGGHGDSFYNQLFAFDLGQMTWQRLTEMPVGATPSKASPEMNYVPIEPCGYYPKGPVTVPQDKLNDAGTYIRYEACDAPEISALLDDQQPRSSHTYGKCIYDAREDRFCYVAGSYYPSSQTVGPRVPCFSFATGRWSRVADLPDGTRGVAAVDASGHFWSLTGATGKLAEYVPASNTWSLHTSYLHPGGNLTGDVDRKRHHLLVMTDAGVRRFDLNTPAEPGVLLSTTGDAAPSVGRAGFVYADGLDRFVAWNGGGDVYVLDPETLVWTRRTPGGTTLPGPALTNGTYGRFRYSPLRGVFVLTNGVDKNVFVYKP